jgi:RHS repeat-associated protein
MIRPYNAKFIFLPLLLWSIISASGLLFAETGDDAFYLTTRSGFYSNNPAELAFDDDSSTYAMLNTSATFGEISLNAAAVRRISHVILDAYIPAGTMFSIEFLDANGRRQVIPSSFVTEIDGMHTIDLFSENIVTDRLKLFLSGDNANIAELYQIEVFSNAQPTVLVQIPFDEVSASENTLVTENEWALIDGIARTAWRTRMREDDPWGSRLWGMFRSLIARLLSFLEKDVPYDVSWRIFSSHEYNRGTSNRENAWAELSFEEPRDITSIGIYVLESAKGTLDLSISDGVSMVNTATIELNGEQGWQFIDVTSIPGIQGLQSVRLDLSGNEIFKGGIGEVVAIGPGETQAGLYKGLSGWNAMPGDDGYVSFIGEDTDNFEKLSLKVRYSDAVNEYQTIEVNGFPLRLSRVSEQNAIYAAELPAVFLAKDINFINPGQNAIAVTLFDSASLDIYKETANTLLDGSLITSTDDIYGRTVVTPDNAGALTAATVYFDGSAPSAWYVMRDGLEQAVTPQILDEDRAVFRFPLPVDSIVVYNGRLTEVDVNSLPSDTAAPYVDFINYHRFSPFVSEQMPSFILGYTDRPNARIEIGGRLAVRMGNYFWLPTSSALDDQTGLVELEITVKEFGQEEYRFSYPLYVVDDRAVLRVDQNASPYYSADDQFVVSGRILPSFYDVFVNDAQISTSGGRFSYTVPLAPGFNLINIEGRNSSGHSVARRLVRVLLSESSLQIRVLEPQNGAVINSDSFIIRGEVSGDIPASVELDGIPAIIEGSSFRSENALNIDGAQRTVHITVQGRSGIEAEQYLNVNRDINPPRIDQVLPMPGSRHANSLVQISGRALDENPDLVIVNGVAASINGEFFTAYVSFSDGVNPVTITAFDQAGNATIYPEFEIEVDTTAPEIFSVETDILSPTSNTRPVISFSASDAGVGMDRFEISIDEREFFPQESPYQLPFLRDGSHLIRVRAIDALGNYAEESLRFTVDTVAPLGMQEVQAIPGSDRAKLRWVDGSEDTSFYRIGLLSQEIEEWKIVDRSEGLYLGAENQLEFHYESSFEWLVAGEEYSFGVIAVDEAGNATSVYSDSAVIAYAEAEVQTDGDNSIEYYTAEIFLPESSIPDDVVSLSIREVQIPDLASAAENGIIGNIFEFTGYDQNDVPFDSIEFSQPYRATINYSDEDLPTGISELSLQVYYYDPLFAFWAPLDTVNIDTESNTISFQADHFSYFSVQPTNVRATDRDTVNEANISMAGRQGNHGELRISPQTGSVTTSVTDLMLPGKNGLDLTLQRVYSSDSVDESRQGMNFGSGWGLNIPAVRKATDRYGYGSGLEISLMDGTSVNTASMHMENPNQAGTFQVAIPDRLKGSGDMQRVFYSKDENNLAVYVDFERRQDSNVTKQELYDVKSVLVISHDGTIYRFDEELFIQEIYDFSYSFSIIFTWSNEDLLEKITDSYGREVRFTYADYEYKPISRIETDTLDSLYFSEYSYTLISGKPVLSEVQDSEGRIWNYNYEQRTQYRWVNTNSIRTERRVAYVLVEDDSSSEQGTGSEDDEESEPEYDAIPYTATITSYYLERRSGTSIPYLVSAVGPGIGYNRVSYQSMYQVYNRETFNNNYVTLTSPNTKIKIGEHDSGEWNKFWQRWDRGFQYSSSYAAIVHQIMAVQSEARPEESSSLVETVSYDYFYNVSDNDRRSLWTDGIFNPRTRVSDGRSESIFDYRRIEKSAPTGVDFPWYSDTGEQNEDLGSYKIPVTKRVLTKIGGVIVSRSAYGYDSFGRVTSQSTERGEHSQEYTYSYDWWSNISVSSETVKGPGYTYETVRYTEFATDPAVFARAPGELTINEGFAWPTSPLDTEVPDADVMIPFAPLYSAVKYSSSSQDISDEQISYVYYGYNSRGFIAAKAVDQDGIWAATEYEYHPEGSPGEFELSKIILPNGLNTSFTYDYSPENYYMVISSRDNLLDADESPVPVTSVAGYELSTGNVAWETDERGYTTSYAYDTIGRLTIQIQPDDDDALGWNPTSSIDGNRSNNPITIFEYDDENHIVSVIDPLENTEEYVFDLEGKLIRKSVFTQFDVEGDFISQPRRVDVLLTYDAFDNLLSLSNELGYITTYQYDGLDRLEQVIHPEYLGESDERIISFDYESLVQTTMDERGITTREYQDYRGSVLRMELIDREGFLASTMNRAYDAMGNLLRETDADGNETWFEYDNRGNQILIRLPESAHISPQGSEYRSSPMIWTEYDLMGQATTRYQTVDGVKAIIEGTDFDLVGRPVRNRTYYADPDGTPRIAETVTYYDAAGNPERIVNPLGFEVSSEYSARGQVTAQIDAAEYRTEFEYDKLDRITLMRDPRHYVSDYSQNEYELQYFYDDRDRLISAILPAVGSIAESPVISFRYDDAGRVTGRTEADGMVTEYRYSPRNFLISEIVSGARLDGSPLSYATEYVRDGVGNVLTQIAPGGLESTMEYDAFGNMIKQYLPKGLNYRAVYDERGLLREQWSGNQLPTYFEYDELGRNTEIIDAAQGITSIWYDDRGNVARTIDPAGDTFTVEYDLRGLVIRETNSRGRQWGYEYDTAGNLIESVDPRGTRATYIYDRRNLLRQIDYTNQIEGLSHYQSFDYDEVGQLITADDNGVTTRYNSDGGGYLSDPYGLVRNVITEGFGGSFSTEYGYDIALRMNSVNYSDNQTTNYLYNNLGQLEQIPYYIDQMNYNFAGLLSSYTMANDVQATFAYDENYRLSSMIYTNQLGELKSYSYQYDMDDNIIYQNGDYYSYDRLGRLQSAMITGDAGLTEWQPAQSQQSYGVVQEDVLGDKPIELTTDDAQISTDSESVVIDAGFGYAFKRIYLPVTSINENLVNEQTLQVFIAQYNGEESWERVYNADINIQTDGVTITLPNATFGRYIKIHSTVHRLNADGLPVRLETILDVDTDGIIITAVAGGRNEFYRYSSDGNRTGRSILAGEMSSEDYQYYSDSDLLKLNGEYAYRYDENGNLIEKGTVYSSGGDTIEFQPQIGNEPTDEYWLYTWDLLNRLVKVESWDQDSQTLVIVAEYGYDINNLRIYKSVPGEAEYHYVFDQMGNRLEEHITDLTNGDTFSSYYIFRNGRHVAKRDDSGDVFFYSTDHLGSTVLVTNHLGQDVWRGDTSPFGDSVSGSGELSDSERLKYTGKDYDEDIGLYYFNARWYDADTARFVSEDPAQDGVSWFAYVGNNPLKYVDPTGLRQVQEAITEGEEDEVNIDGLRYIIDKRLSAESITDELFLIQLMIISKMVGYPKILMHPRHISQGTIRHQLTMGLMEYLMRRFLKHQGIFTHLGTQY